MITPLGTLQNTLWMSHSGTSQVLSLGKFRMFPSLSQWGHPSHMTWDTANTLQGSLWMSHSGTLQLHSVGKFKMFSLYNWWEHLSHMIQDTVNVLDISQAREIAGTLAGKILNVLVMCWAGTCMVLCPFPCNVLVMYWPGTLALAPSARRSTRTSCFTCLILVTPFQLVFVFDRLAIDWFMRFHSNWGWWDRQKLNFDRTSNWIRIPPRLDCNKITPPPNVITVKLKRDFNHGL